MKMHTLAVCRERNVLSVGHNLLPVLILNAGDIYQVIELTKLVFFFFFFLHGSTTHCKQDIYFFKYSPHFFNRGQIKSSHHIYK